MKIDCRKCKWYYRLVDYKGKSRGYVCGMWLEGISDSEGGSPSERCFTPRKEEGK